MGFKALFIGIDRYASPLISNLSCAVRDAQALYGLFSDTFGGSGTILLVNEQATRSATIDHIESLQQADSNDIVVIAFSGHGSDAHHLITHDADPLLLDSTAIPLDDLTELFAKIPASNLLLLLDCCFAGGAGAKVFHAPVASKDIRSAESLLNRISGRGRLIFTAATATQEAIEDRRRRHGLFTFYVLEALQGAPEVANSGLIPILSFVEFVTRSVIAAARQIRHEQEPAIRGTAEGIFSFPVLRPGDTFTTFFPGHTPLPVGPDVSSLASFGFPPDLIDIWRGSIPSLNELQQDAINHFGLLNGEHLVVSAPTSSGKTMIGELAALQGYLKGDRSFMLLPLRALVNDKHAEFVKKYGAYGLRVIRSTGEISDNNEVLLRGKYDIALLTYERFAALAVTGPHILRQVGLVVVDEVQMITDRNRGANLEFILTLLKAQRLFGVEPQIIALSAVIGDTHGFESWLSARLLMSDKRPVPLDEGLIDLSGQFRYIGADGSEGIMNPYVLPEYRKGSSQDIIIPLVRKLVVDGEKVIVFRDTKPVVRATTEYLKNNLGLPPATEVLDALPTGDPSVASAQLRGCLEHGVAFHNADLDREERQAIEEGFREPTSSLKVLVSTTTLAMGVNTPAWSVVIAGLQHPDGPYTVAEYKNMAGRAGRLGFTLKGKSFLVASSPGEAYTLWSRYVLGKPESLTSRFADQEPLSLVCRVLATASSAKTAGFTERELIDFIQSTFGAYQQGRVLSESTVRGVLQRLMGAGLVEQLEDRFRLTELGKVAGELGIQVESVVRLGRALLGLPPTVLTDRVILAAAQVTVELDDVLFPIHRTSIQERQRWRGTIHDQRLPGSVMRELQATNDVTYTLRCKKLSAVLMWTEGIELNRLESSLLKHLPGGNAAGPIRATAERTRDLIGVVARVGTLLSTEGDALRGNIDTLGIQLELGIPGDVLWLARETRRGLERGDYLALKREGLSSLEALQAVDDQRVFQILRSKTKVGRIREAIKRIESVVSLAEDDVLPQKAIE
jgi:replicative superfamily II helicase